MNILAVICLLLYNVHLITVFTVLIRCQNTQLVMINMFCFQEGTLKKINKDRNAKTLRNVQEGLPFTIDDVKRQTEDPKLLATVSKV